ncbi:Apolipoprotein N-acyltransferase / Copper homeostasis protein CutE [hydrothermal vent metagenome]|uniref:Apolipoprotein N-acyltransferase / Copper homeostasis protein CutE n=1 Tax=hydrothermal vent metagenome TaxID=652676 RepID=A0A3B1BA91_9ZZZZ
MRPIQNKISALLKTPHTAAFAAGALAVLAFAPFALSPIAILSLATLFWLWSSASPKQAFQLGWLFGVGLLGFGVSWLHISIDKFGGVGFALAVIITLLFVLALGLFFGLAGWFCAKIGPTHSTVRLLVIYPAIWVLVEWVRGWFLGGFPWLSLGYAQLDTSLQGFAPVLGVFGVSWVVALLAGSLVLVLKGLPLPLIVRSELDASPGVLRPVLLIVLMSSIWLLGGLLESHSWTEEAGKPLKVSMIQANIPQELKWKPEQFEPTIDLYVGLTKANWESDLIIWPETAIPAFFHQVEQELLNPLEAEAKANNTDLLIGIAVHNRDDKRYFNAMVSLGQQRDAYYKRHLVPFGEFLPLKWLLDPLITFLKIPMSDFSAGEKDKSLLHVAGYPAGISICYEDAFGEEVIQSLPDAAFLINASNDAWFGDSLAPHQHLEIARMRALETERYLLRATNTGVSAVIGPHGEIQGLSPAFKTDVLTRDITPLRGMTPYARVGNWGIVSIALLLLGIGIVLTRRGNTNTKTSII